MKAIEDMLLCLADALGTSRDDDLGFVPAQVSLDEKAVTKQGNEKNCPWFACYASSNVGSAMCKKVSAEAEGGRPESSNHRVPKAALTPSSFLRHWLLEKDIPWETDKS